MRILRERPLLALAGLLLASAALALLVGLGGLDADALLERRAWLSALAGGHPLLTALAFSAAYVVGMSLALPLGGVLGILAGFLFGRWPGLALVVACGTISAVLVFWSVARLAGPRRPEDETGSIARLAAGMRRHGFLTVLAMRIIPAFPFFVVTAVAALAGVGRRAFVAATVIGKVPASLIYVGFGCTLGTAGTLEEVVSRESIVGLTCLGLLALAPLAVGSVRQLQLRRYAASRSASPAADRRTAVSAS